MASKTLKASILLGGTMSSGLKGALGSTRSGVLAIGDAVRKVTREQQDLGKLMNGFQKLGGNIDNLRAKYAALGREVDRLRAAQQRLALTEKAIQDNMDRRSDLRGKLAGAVGGTIAGALPVGASIANAAKYNRENQLIGNTANMTAEQIRELSSLMMKTSAESNQMTNDVQRGVGFMVAAGLKIGVVADSIRTVARTTTAAGAEIEDMSKAAFTLIDSLKIDPKNLQDALDILAYAGKEGNVELRDMAKSLPVLGSGFTALKMQGREAAATMGAALEVARKGAADADEAANNMKNYIAKIMSPETLKKAKKNFNLDLYKIITDAQKKGKNPFEASMIAIMKATKGDQKLIGDLFQDMQVQNFIRPMIQNWDEYKRIKDEALNKSSGLTDRDFAKIMGTEAEKMKAAKAAADRLAKTLGTVLGPTVGSTAEKIGQMLERMTVFVRENPKLVVGAVKIAAGFAAMRVATLGLGYAFTFIRGPALKVMKFIGTWRAAGAAAAMGRFAGIGMRVLSVVRLLGAAVAAIGGGPVTIAIGALVAGAILVRKYWEPIKTYFTALWETFRTEVSPAVGQLMEALKPLGPIWEQIKAGISDAVDWLFKLIAPSQFSQQELSTVAKVGRIVGTVLGHAFKTGVEVITAAVKAMLWFRETAVSVATMVRDAFTGAFNVIKIVVGGAMAHIKMQLSPLTSAIGWVMDKVGMTSAGAAPAMATAGGGRAPVALPAPAGARGSAQTTVQQSNTFNITQQPGESQEALARRIIEEQKRQGGVRDRGSLVDKAN